MKKFVAIYGENGCGKTNLVLAFEALKQMMLSRFTYEMWQDIRNGLMHDTKRPMNVNLFFGGSNIFFDLQSYRMIGEKEPTEIEYGFLMNGIEGYYYIKFADDILEEELYYNTGKQRGVHFKIENVNGKIESTLNSNIFIGPKYASELMELIDKYWGKHSFLSILYEEMNNKNRRFILENISENLVDTIDEFNNVVIKHDKSLNILNFKKIGSQFEIAEGEIGIGNSDVLERYEKVLRIFFTQAYSDIKDVYYEKESTSSSIQYQLYFKKLIAGEVRDIPYSDESNGTKKILNQLSNIIETLDGKTVIIDEIDNGIHDILMKNMIMSIKDEITGQLIVTTHNTLLLENLPVKELYLIMADYNGNKSINCIADYDFKVQKNHNVRDLYFKGVFGGVPTTDYIDFEEIKHTLFDGENKEVEK